MPLESLLEVVRTIRKRIEKHEAALSKSEALTRNALIDPLLRELGWDTSDPALVTPEFKIGRGKADYALFSNGEPVPVMVVEAKKLGTPLDEAADQGIEYCVKDGIEYFAVTDGGVWQIYETHLLVPLQQKLKVEFNLRRMEPAKACLEALALWRPSIDVGSVTPARTLVVQPSVEEPPQVAPMPTPPPVAPIQDAGLVPLAELPAISHSPPPKEIRFPDGSAKPMRRWKAILVESARWLVDNGHLGARHAPLALSDRGTRYLLAGSPSGTPVHSNEAPFALPAQVGPELYLETKHSAAGYRDNAVFLIQHVGQDPAQFKVRLPEG